MLRAPRLNPGRRNSGLVFSAIVATPFYRRQTADAPFSHFSGTEQALLQRIEKAAQAGHVRPGYRDGVVLVDLDNVSGIFTALRRLKAGDRLAGFFEPRRPGEEPRKQVSAAGKKTPAKMAYAVLYRSDVLAEDGNSALPLPPSTENWELISLNASPELEDVPIDPVTLMYNHFHLSGGTATGMSDSEFVAALRKSLLFWKDKSMVAGK